MYRFTKNYFKPMKNSVYDKRRGNGRDFELRANAGNGRAVWQKIFFGYQIKLIREVIQNSRKVTDLS